MKRLLWIVVILLCMGSRCHKTCSNNTQPDHETTTQTVPAPGAIFLVLAGLPVVKAIMDRRKF